MKYEKQEGAGIWIPEKEGEILAGEITEKDKEGLYGTQYTIKKSNGEEIKTPSHKVLQARMSKISPGDQVKLVFINEVPPAVKGQKPTKIYEVYKGIKD